MVKFDDDGGAASWFRQFIRVPFLDGSNRYVSQAQWKEDLLNKSINFIFCQAIKFRGNAIKSLLNWLAND